MGNESNALETEAIFIDCNKMMDNNTLGPVEFSEEIPPLSKMWKMAQALTEGGEYSPACSNPQDVAIIVPFRNREEQLPKFLGHLHSFLAEQGFIHYRIYIINQEDSFDFNRASLMNAGFIEALKDFNWSCFIFHDVDHLPEDTRNIYTCKEEPRLLAVAVDKWEYNMPYKTYFGGVVAVMKDQYEKINGASNMFWGWGGEDDDLRNRLVRNGFNATMEDKDIARYSTLWHEPAKRNPDRMKILKQGKQRSESDGINSLNYELKSILNHPFYTRISVELNKNNVNSCNAYFPLFLSTFLIEYIRYSNA